MLNPTSVTGKTRGMNFAGFVVPSGAALDWPQMEQYLITKLRRAGGRHGFIYEYAER